LSRGLLKIWTGNAGDKGLLTVVAAPTQRQAIELLASRFVGRYTITGYEFRKWWARSFNPDHHALTVVHGKGILRQAPGVWQRAARSGRWLRRNPR